VALAWEIWGLAQRDLGAVFGGRSDSRLARALFFPVPPDFRVDLGKRHLLLGPPRGNCRGLDRLQPLEHDESPSVHTASSLRFGKRRSTVFGSWIEPSL
jgi:hypothetical protein